MNSIPLVSIQSEAWRQAFIRVRHEPGFEIVEDALQAAYRPRCEKTAP